MKLKLFLTFAFGLFLLPPGYAIDQESFADQVLQKRYVSIITELRCLVCQNQSIEDSNAPLAQDLRRQVREQLYAGRSDQEIMGYMVERYGDYVRYRPPLKWTTAGLWLAPVIIAVLGFFMLFLTLRRHLNLGASDEAEILLMSTNEHQSDSSTAVKTASDESEPEHT